MGLELSGVAARRFRVVGPLCAPGVRGVFSQVCVEVGRRAGHRKRGDFRRARHAPKSIWTARRKSENGGSAWESNPPTGG